MSLVKIVSGGLIFNAMNERIRNGKETKTTIFNISKKVENVKLNNISDTGNAYIMKVSARLTVSALLKLFSKSGSDFEYRLYRDSVSMFRESLTGDITSFLEKWSVFEEDVETRYPEMNDHERINHEFSMIDLGGQKKRIFDIWTEVVETEKGKEKDSFNISINHDVYDIYMTCYQALAELVNYGIITEYSDLWEYRSFGYQAITKLMRENRKYQYSKNIDIESDSYMNFDSDNEDEPEVNQDTYITRFFNHTFSSIESESVRNSVIDFLSRYLEKRKNRDTVILSKIFRMSVFENKSQEDIASIFGMSQKNVSLSIGICKELLLSPYGLKFLLDSDIISEGLYQKFLELDKVANS